ncbi:hypothetical protein GXW78_01170 [Roseomonas terrae]|uniref:Uncharacterized protein n=1 Tax=Neoroseomonas terrae TaxID=424799 RepID=A0ABS5EBC5_9PROT|nr:hypothetical protein [Neoroseomonas terrae]MBR0648260.1 hypothetical protein [Neoroseomonas terrae]
MSDKDYVFSRLGPTKPSSGDRRELLTIPRKDGSAGRRVVEVVHVRAGDAPPGRAPVRRPGYGSHSETWEHGFPARSATPPLPLPAEPIQTGPAEPVAHIMPMWEPAPVEPEPSPPEPPRPAPMARKRGRPAAVRRVADPFDTADDGMNCLRCGYVVESAREQRGLMTCAACG